MYQHNSYSQLQTLRKITHYIQFLTNILFTNSHSYRVIYIIADSSSPPLFSSYTANQRYNSVVLANGAVIDVAATVRIQALLDASYYNQLIDYVRFSIGDGGTFLFNGLAVDNIPLRPGTEYQISYYILFNNADGVSIVCLYDL